MKKTIYFLVAVLITCFLSYKLLNQKEFMRSEKSPDGKYHADIYVMKSPFDVSMPGGGGIGSKLSYIEVFDENGNFIGKTNHECSVFFSEVNLKWDLKEHLLNFAVARYINLETGKCNL